MEISILGCGYVGACVAKSAVSLGASVLLSTTSPDKVAELKKISPHVIVVDPSDEASYAPLLKSPIILISVAPKSRDAYESTYAGCAKTIHDLVEKTGWKGQLIYTSSTGVYAEDSGRQVFEDSPLKPGPLTTAEKLYLEIPGTCILRLSEIIGPGREPLLAAGRSLPGDGSNIVNQVHVEDIGRAIEFVIEHQLTGIYNLANDTHCTRKSFYEKLQIPVTWDPARKSAHGARRIVASKKIKELGFTFKHPTTL